MDPGLGVPDGELDGLAEHRHVTPGQDGRVARAGVGAPVHGGVHVICLLVAHAACGGGEERSRVVQVSAVSFEFVGLI